MAAEGYRLVTRSDFDGLVCAMLLKQLVNGDPKHAGRLHRDGINPARQQSGDKGVQIRRKGEKHAHGLRIAIRWNGNHNLCAANVKTSAARDGT